VTEARHVPVDFFHDSTLTCAEWQAAAVELTAVRRLGELPPIGQKTLR
jgi:hypothetical protein